MDLFCYQRIRDSNLNVLFYHVSIQTISCPMLALSMKQFNLLAVQFALAVVQISLAAVQISLTAAQISLAVVQFNPVRVWMLSQHKKPMKSQH